MRVQTSRLLRFVLDFASAVRGATAMVDAWPFDIDI